MPSTLIITNDFPPRVGGIERFVEQVCGICDGDVVVLTSTEPGGVAHDADLPYEVVRRDRVLLPSLAVARQAQALLRRSGATRVVFGAAAPLGLLAADLRRAGAQRIVGLTHGHETWWAQVPGARSLLRRIARDVDALTTISRYTADVIWAAVDPVDRPKLCHLAPPIDTAFFAPRSDWSRSDWSRSDWSRPTERGARRPRCVAVGRLVRRKGVDTLVRAWRVVASEIADAELVVVGDGPQRKRLTGLADRLGLARCIRFTGACDQWGVRRRLWTSDVFALPMRVRLAGLDSEGLGIAALEAAACGLPVVVGASGGAPETVLDGRSGFVVPPEQPDVLASRLVELLDDPGLRTAMGAIGRRHVQQRYRADRARARLRRLLELD